MTLTVHYKSGLIFVALTFIPVSNKHIVLLCTGDFPDIWYYIEIKKKSDSKKHEQSDDQTDCKQISTLVKLEVDEKKSMNSKCYYTYPTLSQDVNK